VDWSSSDLAVVRSCWNYFEREEEFRNWIIHVAGATRLWNPAELMLRTIHKSYLGDLEKCGIPIVPTAFIYRCQPQSLRAALETTRWTQFVVKPAVSAASYKTRRFATGQLQEAQKFLDDILLERDAMVQRFLPRVAEGGEIDLNYIDGELTHGVVKHPRFKDDLESVSEAFQPTNEQRAVANRVMATVHEPWLYGRVDLMQTDEGQWVLSELELIEPSLFLLQHPPALDRFVRALVRLSRRSVF